MRFPGRFAGSFRPAAFSISHFFDLTTKINRLEIRCLSILGIAFIGQNNCFANINLCRFFEALFRVTKSLRRFIQVNYFEEHLLTIAFVVSFKKRRLS